jgi:hypothetical protein
LQKDYGGIIDPGTEHLLGHLVAALRRQPPVVVLRHFSHRCTALAEVTRRSREALTPQCNQLLVLLCGLVTHLEKTLAPTTISFLLEKCPRKCPNECSGTLFLSCPSSFVANVVACTYVLPVWTFPSCFPPRSSTSSSCTAVLSGASTWQRCFANCCTYLVTRLSVIFRKTFVVKSCSKQ